MSEEIGRLLSSADVSFLISESQKSGRIGFSLDYKFKQGILFKNSDRWLVIVGDGDFYISQDSGEVWKYIRGGYYEWRNKLYQVLDHYQVVVLEALYVQTKTYKNEDKYEVEFYNIDDAEKVDLSVLDEKPLHIS